MLKIKSSLRIDVEKTAGLFYQKKIGLIRIIFLRIFFVFDSIKNHKMSSFGRQYFFLPPRKNGIKKSYILWFIDNILEPKS